MSRRVSQRFDSWRVIIRTKVKQQRERVKYLGLCRPDLDVILSLLERSNRDGSGLVVF